MGHGIRIVGFARTLVLAAAGMFGASAAWAEDFVNVPIVINIMAGSDVTEDQAKDAIKAANEIYKQAGVKFTLHKVNTDVADPSGDEGSTLTREDRDKLRENGVNELPEGKGVKITFAAQPSSTDENVNALTVHKTPCSICRKTARTGETMAHEIGHILTLSDLYGEGTEGRLMHGVFSTRTGTELTDAEKEEIKKEAEKRACKVEVKEAAAVPAEPKNNGGGLGTNLGTLVPAAPAWQNVLMGQFTRIDPDPFYQFRINSAGIIPPSQFWAYDILFNTDADDLTGLVQRGIPGIDARMFVQISGDFVFGQLTVFNPPMTMQLPVQRIIEPEYATVLTGEPSEFPGADVIEFNIPIPSLPNGSTSPTFPVHIVSGPDPLVSVDVVSLNFVRDQRLQQPHVAVSPPNVTPGASPFFLVQGTGFSPFAEVEITLDDLSVGFASADPLGNLAQPVILTDVPGGMDLGTDNYFVTVQEFSEDATFGYTVIHLDLGGPGCPTCAADFNQDGGIDGADVQAFFEEWENGQPCADVNQDGGIDGSDVGTFFEVWEAGGC